MTTTTPHAKARWTAALLATTTVFALTLSGCTVAAVAADPLDANAAADAPALELAPAEEVQAASTIDVAEAPTATPALEEPAAEPAPEPAPQERREEQLVPTAASTNDPDPQNPLTLTFSLPEANVHGWYVEDLVASVRVTSSISSNPLVEWTTTGAQSGSGQSLGSASIPITSGGETVLTVTAVDEEGNSVGPVTRRIKLDKTNPVNTLLSPTRPVYRLGDSVTLQYTCDDPESGVNACGATIINNTTRPNGYVQVLDQLGTFEARAHGSNEAGLFAADSHTFRVIDDESAAPTVAIDAPGASNGWWRGPATVVLTADDGDGAGVRRVEYRTFDDGVPGPWLGVDGEAATFTTAGEGDNRYQVRAIDWFDNVGTAQTVSFPTDATAPSVSVNLPEDGITVEPGAELVLDYSCTDAASGIEACEAPVADGEALDTDELGTFEVVVRAVDAAGNVTRVVRSYTVAEADAAGPAIDFSAPAAEASGWYFSGPSVTVTATDASAIEIIEWEILTADGSLYTEGSRSGVDELVVAGTDFPDGVTTLRVRAVDALGNETIAEFTVRVDVDAPAVRVVSPAELDEVEQGSVVSFVFECEDDVSGVETCESSVGDVLPTGTLGEQLVTITATDVAGQSTTVEIAYTVVPAADPAPGGGATGGGATAAPVLASTGGDTVWLTLLVALGLLVVGGVAAGSVSTARRER
ncbi:hypothetical protein H4J02_02280 [Protaetiibacter sp. SSC-01]|uniref:hypothetical protein n=1 Tax=Protaetiibacter sp. SSC-01 TaxID=2759943 RepID=UPI001656C91B|nr:hypothetical protein [Protaetiibacter sp. SSC-01]QNO37891.1 hypothetical protein H4J02_02280 [Protaetiibacter sp. SSC-01]